MKNKKRSKRHYSNGEKSKENKGVLTRIIIRYFDKNNLGRNGYILDKETVSRYRVYKYFDDIIYENVDEDLDMNVAVKKLQEVLPELRYLYRVNDKTGGTPYDDKNDYGNLCYVSGKWYCDFRLLWLIQLAERNDKYEKVIEDGIEDWVKLKE